MTAQLRKMYHVYDRALASDTTTTSDRSEALAVFKGLLDESFRAVIQESDDGLTWRDVTDDVTEELANGWLDEHARYEWDYSLPNWVWQSTAYYQRENRAEFV